MSIPTYHFIDKLKTLPQIEQVYLFGSRARGDNNERSDIDLAIKLSDPNDMSAWSKIMDIIDEADTLLEVDCLNLDKIDEVFRQRIEEQGKVIYERQTKR